MRCFIEIPTIPTIDNLIYNLFPTNKYLVIKYLQSPTKLMIDEMHMLSAR